MQRKRGTAPDKWFSVENWPIVFVIRGTERTVWQSGAFIYINEDSSIEFEDSSMILLLKMMILLLKMMILLLKMMISVQSRSLGGGCVSY